MVQALLTGITNFFFFIIKIIGSIFFLPISLLLGAIFPDASSFMPYMYYFLDNQLFPMLKFAIQTIVTVSHCPVPIFLLIANILLFRWAIIPALRSILLVYNVYQTAKGVKQYGAAWQ